MQNINKQPKSKITNVIDDVYGVRVTDPYRWLEEEDKKTAAWIKKQNSYTKSLIDKIPVKRKLNQQLKKLYKIDSIKIIFS